MPLGKSPVLQNDLMAESDNSKYLLFNDALVRLEDSVNRNVVVDLTSADVTVTESQFLGYGLLTCTGHTVARTLTFPTTVGSPAVDTNRTIAVRNDGTDQVTVTHDNAGEEIIISAGSTGLLYMDGTDIVSLGGVANAAIGVYDGGVLSVAEATALDFDGDGYAVTDDGLGTVTVTFSYRSDADVKTAYENNADTNAFTDALSTKLTNIETSATADQTGAEIVTALDTELGSTDWQTGGGSTGVDIVTETAAYSIVDGDLAGNRLLKVTNASAVDVTVPPSLTGTEPLTVVQSGAGQVSFVAGAGVTINSASGNLSLQSQWSSAALIPDGADNYILIGDLVA